MIYTTRVRLDKKNTEFIKAKLKEYHITINDFAKQLKINRVTLSDIIHGRRTATWEFLEYMSTTLYDLTVQKENNK